MMNNLFTNPIFLLLAAFVVLIIGVLIGFLLSSLFRHETSEAEPPNKNLTEVAHLWRDQRDGRLVFQVENEYYKRSNDLTSKEKKILLKVVMDFYQWLEPPSAITAEPTEQDAIELRIPRPIENVPEPRQERVNPMEMFTQALDADVSTADIPSQSIVAQIDEILQEKLIAANMQRWAVRLAEFPNRGMVVLVGLEQYDGIDAVPYERVRVIIREAVTEWEQREER